MTVTFGFAAFSMLLGAGLAMDAFSVSVADGLREPKMSLKKGMAVSAVFGLFQAVMPFLGWICVHALVERFKSISGMLPWISFLLLLYIGGEMIYDGIKTKKNGFKPDSYKLTVKALVFQGFATSVDALSVGFTIGEYVLSSALLCVAIIGILTFLISLSGVMIGKKAGGRLTWQADVSGGVILVGIGIKILVSGVLS